MTEALAGVREESPPAAGGWPRERIFFPFGLGQRTTQWERGVEPMTQFTFTAEPDAYGLATRQLTVAVPRGRDPRESLTAPAEPYLATTGTTEYARRDDAEHYLVDRVARTTSYEVVNDGTSSVFELRDAVLADAAGNARVAAGDRAQPHLLRRGAVSSGCRWDSSATTAWPSAPSRWRSPTASSTSSSTPPIRWRSARGPPISTRPARRPGGASIPTSSAH